jgi:hypothetical protein
VRNFVSRMAEAGYALASKGPDDSFVRRNGDTITLIGNLVLTDDGTTVSSERFGSIEDARIAFGAYRSL